MGRWSFDIDQVDMSFLKEIYGHTEGFLITYVFALFLH